MTHLRIAERDDTIGRYAFLDSSLPAPRWIWLGVLVHHTSQHGKRLFQRRLGRLRLSLRDDPRLESRHLSEQLVERGLLSRVVIPIDIERRLDAVRRQRLQVRAADDVLLLNTECEAHRMDDLRHRATDEVQRVLDATCPLKWRRIKGDAQLLPTEATCLLSERDRTVDQLLVQIVRHHARPKPNERALTERGSLGVERSEDQLPTAIVLRRLDRIRVAQAVVPLEQHDHREHRWRTGLLSSRSIACNQLLFEAVREQLLPNTPEEPVKVARGPKAARDIGFTR